VIDFFVLILKNLIKIYILEIELILMAEMTMGYTVEMDDS
jgi:hypothetical protein